MKYACVYVEADVLQAPRTLAILDRIGDVPVIPVDRYGEVFNRNAQNFRLQKKQPALILARKHGRLVLPAPGNYGFEAPGSFYFSHMLNCVYDCRYCFLQGMYRSAHHVLFVNYEEFTDQIGELAAAGPGTVFYSGYDCDSLALEPISGFVNHFVSWFACRPDLMLEIRTKSTQVRELAGREPLSNCVIAMSFTPEHISRRWESKVPSLEKRLESLSRLQRQGWPVALRFEPVIWTSTFEADYQDLLERIFERLDAARLHSVSTGLFRLPKIYFDRIEKLYPDEPLFARGYECRDGMVAQSRNLEQQMRNVIEALLFRHIEDRQYYRCA